MLSSKGFTHGHLGSRAKDICIFLDHCSFGFCCSGAGGVWIAVLVDDRWTVRNLVFYSEHVRLEAWIDPRIQFSDM